MFIENRVLSSASYALRSRRDSKQRRVTTKARGELDVVSIIAVPENFIKLSRLALMVCLALKSYLAQRTINAAMNPCLCGFHADAQKPCTCAPVLVTKYQKRISGPLLDRIDIHIEVPVVDYEKLSGDRGGEPSECIRRRVQAAWNIQTKQFSMNDSSDIVCNADVRVGEIRQDCKLQAEGQRVMRSAMTQLNLSARRLRSWRGVKKSSPHVWRRRCNTARN